jgi:di/tricarboxylate transporter
MLVDMNSPLVGLSIEEAGLRQLQGMYLAEIDRNGVIIPAVTPKEILRGGDRLVFVGIVDSVVELRRMRGLRPAYDQHFKLDTPRHQRCLIEAVASNTCPMLGISIRDGHFRQRYNAVVIAVARNGERIKQKIGDIVLHAGDTLLLEAPLTFVEEHRNSRDFFLVSPIEDSQLIRYERAPLAISILVIMVLLAATGWLSMLQATLVAASMMLLTRCCSLEIARRNIDWTVLVAIGASFGLGSALEVTGAADHIAHYLMSLIGNNPWASLVVIYVLTVCFTELITNNAAAALMFPFASNIAQDLHVNIIPYAVAIMMAASASFATPIGYQTNLMVYGPGGYRFTDYFRLGIPLNILTGIISLLIIFYLWPFK